MKRSFFRVLLLVHHESRIEAEFSQYNYRIILHKNPTWISLNSEKQDFRMTCGRMYVEWQNYISMFRNADIFFFPTTVGS